MYQLKKGMKDPKPKQCSGEERRQKSSAESRWITNYRELVLTSIQILYDGETTGAEMEGGGGLQLTVLRNISETLQRGILSF